MKTIRDSLSGIGVSLAVLFTGTLLFCSTVRAEEASHALDPSAYIVPDSIPEDPTNAVYEVHPARLSLIAVDDTINRLEVYLDGQLVKSVHAPAIRPFSLVEGARDHYEKLLTRAIAMGRKVTLDTSYIGKLVFTPDASKFILISDSNFYDQTRMLEAINKLKEQNQQLCRLVGGRSAVCIQGL